jgi:hypothetical protein
VFVPKSIVCLREGYTREGLLRDIAAGVVVGIVALPLALAFAIASGVPPERGLYTAIVAGFLISALGGSRVQIGGPTGAFVVIVYGIVAQHGYGGLLICTPMAGVMLIVLGLARMGALIKFIPYPVITGFTSGMAVIIFSSQIKDLLGPEDGSGAGGLRREVGRVRGSPGQDRLGRGRRLGRDAADPHPLAARVTHRAEAFHRHARRDGSGAAPGSPDRDDRLTIRRRAVVAPRAAFAEDSLGAPARPRLAGPHDRTPGGDRIAALGSRGGRHWPARATNRTWSWSRRVWRTSAPR